MAGRSSDDAPSPDPLSDVLQDLRPSRASYCRSELTRPWGLDLPYQTGVRFHVVVDGGCWLVVPDAVPVRLDAGDVVFLPHGTGHVIADAPGTPARTLAALGVEWRGDTTARLRAGGGGARSLVVCCTVAFDEPALHPLLALLPAMLLVRAADHADPSLSMLLDWMAEEVRAQRIGAATVMARLADVVLTRVIRAWIEARPAGTTGWLAAVRDPRVGRAVAAIHREPGAAWSVDALARLAGMSRSSFSARFSALLGESPARYVLRWRMHRARDWLRDERLTVAQIADRLGYDSEAAFSRAFKRVAGASPGAMRSPVSSHQTRTTP